MAIISVMTICDGIFQIDGKLAGKIGSMLMAQCWQHYTFAYTTIAGSIGIAKMIKSTSGERYLNSSF